MSLPIVRKTLKLRNRATDAQQSSRYYRFSFRLPEGCGQMTLSMDIETNFSAQIPLILFDARGRVRLIRAANATIGKAHTQYTLSPAHADAGCVPGDLPSGEWKLLLYKRRMFEDIDALISVDCERAEELPPESQIENPAVQQLRTAPFSADCLDPSPGWYCGELHTHSSESTGHTSLEAVLRAAKKIHLDFLALTDHFSIAHWIKEQQLYDGEKPLLLQSVEISGDFGHANVHGLKEWQNPLVDDNEELTAFLGLEKRPTMEAIADAAHSQGALFCINHSLSGIMGWRYRDFPIEKADLYEIFCTAEKQTSLLYPTHWDMFLTRGLHLPGVGSSDSHHPTLNGPWKLGRVLTWVHASSLCQRDILAALKAGHAYVGIEGARMDMHARCGEQNAQMGDTLTLKKGEEAEITIDLIRHPIGNLFLYADGMVLDTIYYDHEGPDTYTLRLPESWIGARDESYIRVEFHAMKEKPRFYGMAFRDYQSARLLSNPIWLKRKEKS